jgi:tRNA-modifying protein YgfZ
MGTEAWEEARIVNGVPAVGAELGEFYSPLEAGLYHAASLAKGCYVGQEAISKVYNTDGVPSVSLKAVNTVAGAL